MPPSESSEGEIPFAEKVEVAVPIARRPRQTSQERLAWWVRTLLVLMALSFSTIFSIAIWLNPYDADGQPRTMATHTQLGLPPCNMVVLIGKPCPACGMTTSFSLLMHGDILNSLRANWAGTLLALGWLALIPWGLISAFRAKYLFIRDVELWISLLVMALLVVMLGRWVYVLLTWEPLG